MPRVGAHIDGEHRLHLWRAWRAGAPSVCWVMLNPSTATAEVDDPTVRKCIAFARKWGYGSIDIVNLYTLRTSDPKHLRAHDYPNHPHATATIVRVLREYAELVVVAWGANARWERARQVDAVIRHEGFRPQALHQTRSGHPGHPLYLPLNAQLFDWSPPA